MACYVIYNEARELIGHMCGQLGPHCSDCGDVSSNLCDFPVGKGKTCDRKICEFHSHKIAPEIHYCDGHHKEWRLFVDAGGVKDHLENVVPFSSVCDKSENINP